VRGARLAHDILLGAEIADHHHAGGDADPRLERRLGQEVEARDGVDQRQAAAHGTLRVILMRLGIAEIDQHAVADAARRDAAHALDHLDAAAMIGGHQLAQILGIKLRRQHRRADEIAKQQRELAALGGDGTTRYCGLPVRGSRRSSSESAAAPAAEPCPRRVLVPASRARRRHRRPARRAVAVARGQFGTTLRAARHRVFPVVTPRVAPSRGTSQHGTWLGGAPMAWPVVRHEPRPGHR
jgi:hypothetical protein